MRRICGLFAIFLALGMLLKIAIDSMLITYIVILILLFLGCLCCYEN
ncbi:MAG: hypothetical protein KIG94_01615 [Acetatifactor sp.]|nr:hypothetical protein [Acetatifactor sp.]